MAKYYGSIGYAELNQDRPGIAEEELVEKKYFGDVLENTRRLQTNNDSINDDIVVSNRISILSDPYALNNFHNIRWAEYMGTKWKVTSVNVKYPRLILTLGGVYNDSHGPSSEIMPDTGMS